MSDQQRGPYTPPREAPPREPPLQFDARGARDARPMPMTLIASGVVLVVLIGGVIMAYAGGFHRKDDPNKLVGDRVLVMKTAPAPGSAAASPPEQTVTFASRSDPAAPSFVAAPEQPAPRPKPQLQLKAQSLPPVRIASAEADTAAPSGLKPSIPTSTLLPTTRPSTALKASPATAAAAPEGVAPATGRAGVQIGAFSSKDLADKGFADVGRLVPTAGHGKRVEAVERGGSTLYRTTVTGFADRDAAKSYCEALAAKGHACIVKG